MNIITKPLAWAYPPTAFSQPLKYLVLHHEAGNGTVEQIHAYHKSLGWAGIAYHLYVRKDGTVYAGRPMDRQGGHCKGYNGISIGICFEGNFENDYMGEAQKAAGIDAVRYALGLYPGLKIVGHRELVATACPGANFPLEEFKKITALPAEGTKPATEGSASAGGAEEREDDSMSIDKLLDEMTPAQAYAILQKAQEHAGALPVPDWAEAEYADAKGYGITDGTRPMGLVTRLEAALMARRAKA